MIDLDATFERNPKLSWTDMDGETVLLDVEHGEYTGLGGVGGRVWELLAEPITAVQICATIVTEFDVDADTCRKDVAAFLDELLAGDLICLR
jgi:Coenzyme PQQ synthesis protein D (PqqD)